MSIQHIYQQAPMNGSELPPEAMPPEGYPPSSGLPPDALMALSGMNGMGSMPMSAGAGGSIAPGMAGGQSGMPQDGQFGASMPASSPGPIAGSPGMDPMMEVRSQFEQLLPPLMAMAEAYPMAQPEIEEAQEALARAMLKIAQGVQPPPMSPPMMG